MEGNNIEVIERDFKCKRSQTFNLFPLGDMHLGSVDCIEHGLVDKVEQIKKDPNALWFGMGDYLDCITKNDPRFEISNLASWVRKSDIIESQRERFSEIFSPIKDKCLGLLTGNHEEEIHHRYSQDITRNLCKDLGVAYGGYTAYLILTFVRTSGDSPASREFVIHAWHGDGAAQTEGARLMRLMRLVNEFEAHIYLMGHLHAMTQHTPDRIACRRGRLKSTKLAATLTGSWLKGYTQPKAGEQLDPSYIERRGYKPSRIGCPVIHLRGDTGEFSIES